MYFTRRRDITVFDHRKSRQISFLDDGGNFDHQSDFDSYDSTDNLLLEPEDDFPKSAKFSSKRRNCWCCIVHTPNTSRFRGSWHSRVLQKFPFLIEMFYWVINYIFYRMTAVLSQRLFAKTGIWDVAQRHGIQVLEIQEFAPIIRWMFPVREKDVQQWFMDGHQDLLTVLNRVYALIHIPGTVG